jgi:hypothetical protein
LNLLRRRFAPAQAAFDSVRLTNDPAEINTLLFGAAALTAPPASLPPKPLSALA